MSQGMQAQQQAVKQACGSTENEARHNVEERITTPIVSAIANADEAHQARGSK